jgi:hypothetical protein
MSKVPGLGDNLYVSQYDLSGDTGSLGAIAGGNSPLVMTGIDKYAFERISGQVDGRIEWSSFFNPAAAAAHAALSPLPTTDRIVSYFRGTTLANPVASMVAKQITYNPTRGADGSLTFAVQSLANGFGIEWGTQHTAGKRTDSSATSPANGVDGEAETDFGLQAYLHIFSLGSGTPTIKLQESTAVDGTADAFADVTGGAFALQAVGSERIATARDQTIERYLRVITTGTFTNLVFAVNVVRNEATRNY